MKTKKLITGIIFSLLSTSALALVVDRDSDGLIEINSLDDLNEIRNDPSGRTFRGSNQGCPDGGCFGFELTRDLDFDTNKNGYLDSGDWNGGQSWVSISSSEYLRFNGNGHTISNVLIVTPSITLDGTYASYEYGFFDPASTLEVHDLRFSSPRIIVDGSANATHASVKLGVVAGRLRSYSIFRQVSVENAVISYSRPPIFSPHAQFVTAGGLLGSGTGLFENVHFDGSIQIVDSSNHIIGGIAGGLYDSYMGGASVHGTLHGSGNIGGIVGSGSGLSLWNGYSTADITSYGSWGNGGLIAALVEGNNPNKIVDTYSVGNVQNGAGLIGFVRDYNSSIELKTSYSKSISTYGGQSYAQLTEYLESSTLILNLDAYQIKDPEGVALPSQAGSYNRPASLLSLQCATNPVSLNCPEPYLLSSWNPEFWDFGTATELPVLIQQRHYPWYSTDSADGSGDYEGIGRLTRYVPQYTCDNPLDFQVKEKKTGYIFSAKTPEVFDFFNAKQGLKCSDAKQVNGQCRNYEVSYLCGGSSAIPQWTSWVSRDNSYGDGGDIESIPSAVCSSGSAIGIRAREVNTSVEYFGAPQIPKKFSLSKGFECENNANGPAGKQNCKDYEVRMVCKVKGLRSNP